MPKIDLSQIKDAVLLTKNLTAAREVRGERDSETAGLTQVTASSASQQFFAAAAAKCGFDQESFERFQAQREAELVRIHEAAHAEAIKNSGRVSAELISQVDSRRKATKALTSPKPFFETIDSPFLIWASPANMLSDSQIEPWKSRAKFGFRSEADQGFREVSFYYLWQNPSDRFAVVNVDGYLIFNGFIRAHQSGGFFPGNRTTSISVSGAMSLFEWWNQPPTQPLAQADQSLRLLVLKTNAGQGFGGDSSTVSQQVFRGCDLRYTLFLVPPFGVTVIEVTAQISHSSGQDGSHNVLVDFESGEFNAMSPFVLIGILT
jgi:hypothetical protein